ncbi:hypothetical protein C2S53_013088 [Perilla frutescens var. hirtella]|uniref:PPM-type phosphatase domain-containing protein n=1 Tax=Perilla frutescens var. hirtella TaxID=608512 RepID=A0AAD4P6Z3_PERFH|nr:hypothetical protein C2S53_013088 [Perilla frutescens var. hirtella]
MPPQQSSCRCRNFRLASKSADSELEAQATKSAKDARRRRMELRRIRSFSQAMSAADPPYSSPDGIMKDETDQGALDLGGGRVCVRRRSYGKISVVGRRREMDEVVAVELGFLKRGEEIYDFFGVFDGRAACSRMLAKINVEEESSSGNEIDWEEVMLEGFDAKISKNGAVVAVVGDNEVVVGGNCDGLKAVLCSGGGGVAVRLLDDDKEDEQVRVRVTKRRRAEYEFLILGSEGFWDVVSDELACQIATADADVEAAAALMAKFAVARGSKHNITVILVDLR